VEDEEKRIFPPCNIEWNVNTGTVLWCTKKRYKFNAIDLNIIWKIWKTITIKRKYL